MSTPTTPVYETPTFYDATNQVIRTMDPGAYIPPMITPISMHAGNTLQALSDGLYVGGSVALPAVVYINTATGVNAPGNGTLTTPYQSLDYALAQLTAASLNMQLQTSAVVALQAGQTFPLVNDLNLYGGTLTLTFYSDPKYGSYSNIPVMGTTTDPEFMSDLSRPIIEPAVSSVDNYWHLAGLNIYGGNVILKGVTVELPMAPAQPAITLYSNAADFVRPMNNTTDGYLELLGAVVNMMDVTAFWGILGINPRSAYTLIQYGSQFQVAGTLLNSLNTTATAAQLAARQYFIKFYPDFVGNNQQQGLLYNTAATATNASGILKVLWADTQSFIITGTSTNLASFPVAYDVIYGLTNYFYGLTYDALSRAINVLSSRAINSAGSSTSSLGTTLIVANNEDLNNLINATLPSVATLTGTEEFPLSRGSGLLQTALTTMGAWTIQEYQGFTQLGTGVAPRAVQSKLRDIINVLDFGADPTGTNDSTLAFTDAGSPVAGAPTTVEVNVTAGTYMLNSNPNPTGTVVWVVHAGVTFTGIGVLPGTVITYSPNRVAVTGNLDVNMAGYGLRVAEGTNAKQGAAPLTAGTVLVNNTSVTANSRIFLTAQDNNTMGALRVSARIPGTSFTITSSVSTDYGVVAYEIFEPG